MFWLLGNRLQWYIRHLRWALSGPCRHVSCSRRLRLPDAVAYPLRRERVACGLGLLALATGSGHSHPDGLDSQRRGTVARWLILRAAPATPGPTGTAAAATDQVDLFSG